MIEIFGSDAAYFSAMLHEWQLEVIDEGLACGDDPEEIAQRAGVCVKTVLRRKTQNLRSKS
jgi:DNA-binding NarL/FixJ family response regulator